MNINMPNACYPAGVMSNLLIIRTNDTKKTFFFMSVHFIGNPSNDQIGIVLYEIVPRLILKPLLILNQSNLMHNKSCMSDVFNDACFYMNLSCDETKIINAIRRNLKLYKFFGDFIILFSLIKMEKSSEIDFKLI